MVIYPFRVPIILNRNLFVQYGGQAGNFSDEIMSNSFLMSEILLTSYIGTPLLPVNLTGTYAYSPVINRMATDYGYVSQINAVHFLTRTACSTCDLTSRDGCAYIHNDTFGYVDVKRLYSTCGCSWVGEQPYQIQLAYQAGLPTGTANLPGIVEALTILAQIDLNEKAPGAVGMNEAVGDVGIINYSSMDDYHEERTASSIIRTNLGSSAKAMYAKRIVDATVKKARKVLLVG